MKKDAKKQKKRKTGRRIVGAGILALIGLFLILGPFGMGLGDGMFAGLGDGFNKENSSDKDDDDDSADVNSDNNEEQNDENNKTETTPEPTAEPTQAVVELKEIVIEVNANKLLYNGVEAESAQKLIEQIAGEYSSDLENLIVKVDLTEAVYDTVEELKLALEGSSIKYEIVE